MEWLSAVKSTPQGFIATLETEQESQVVPLSSLVSRGLPNERRSRNVIDQHIADWCEVEPAEYIQAFGLHCTSAGRSGHAVYAARHKDVRVLIPALAIMRAFFRPNRYLLPKMFAPQALDHVRYLDCSYSPPQVGFYSLTWRNLRGKDGDLRTPISWMSVFPSAMRFAASVHLNARSDRIAVTLPDARVKLALQGKRQGRCLYATNATLLEVDAMEEPMDWASNHPTKIYRRAPVTPTCSPVLRVTDILPRADGALEVDDEEWALIQPVLIPASCSRRRLKLDQRAIFDGLIRKLSLGSGWKSTTFSVGSLTNALYAYRRWTKNGALQRALAILAAGRTPGNLGC